LYCKSIVEIASIYGWENEVYNFVDMCRLGVNYRNNRIEYVC